MTTMASPAQPQPAGAKHRLYPMRLVTKMTGLSADTIRAWERRHGAVTPARTEGNTRRYTSQEVRRLLLLREATRRGHSIGSIAALGARSLERLLAEDQPGLDLLGRGDAVGHRLEEVSQAYVGALCRYDGSSGLDLLLRCATRVDRARFVKSVLIPVAREVEARWSIGSTGSSHRNLFIHHLHALAAHLIRPRTPGSAELARLVVSAEGRGPAEMMALIGCAFLSGGPVEPVFVGLDLRRHEIDWALEMSRARALLHVGVGTAPPSELLGLPAFFFDATRPEWSELERWLEVLFVESPMNGVTAGG